MSMTNPTPMAIHMMTKIERPEKRMLRGFHSVVKSDTVYNLSTIIMTLHGLTRPIRQNTFPYNALQLIRLTTLMMDTISLQVGHV